MDGSTYTKIAVVAPLARVDVALPEDVPLTDLLPNLLDMVGERSSDGGADHEGWWISPLDGHPLDPELTLRELSILDGSLLRLTPTRPVDVPVVHDDVVEAVAAAVRDQTDHTPIAETGQAIAVVAAMAVASLVLVRGGTSLLGAVVAAGLAVGALVVGRILAAGGAPRLGVALAAGGAIAAGSAGFLAVPGSAVAPTLLGAAAITTYSGVAWMIVPRGRFVFTALVTAAALTTLGLLGGLLVGTDVVHALTATSAVAVAAMSTIPWLAVRASRLPMPTVPTTAAELDAAARLSTEELQDRARMGSEVVDGALVGTSVLAAVGVLTSAALGTPLALAYAAVLLLVLLLRVRSVTARAPRLALLLSGLLGAGMALVVAVPPRGPLASLAVALTAVVIVVGVVLASLLGDRRRSAPTSGRGLDLLESVALVSLLPLVVGAIGLYSWVRHL